MTFFTRKVNPRVEKHGKTIKKNVVLIRLKTKNGFTFKTRNFFEKEILRQFYDQTGVRLHSKNLRFDQNNILRSSCALDKFLT